MAGARKGEFLDQIESVLGAGSVTDYERTRAEQDGLIRRGVTKAYNSDHIGHGGIDIRSSAGSPQTINTKLQRVGLRLENPIVETGVGPNQGTGPHIHGRVVQIGRAAPVSNPDSFLSDVSRVSAGTPADRMSVVADAVGSLKAPGDPTAAEPARVVYDDSQIAQRGAAVQGAMDNVDTFLQGFESKLGEHQQQVRQQTEAKVTALTGINSEVAGQTQALKDRVLPVFAARQRIVDQLDHLNTMNPLERGVRGIFDLNYDVKHLEKQLHQFDETLAARGQDYEFLSNLAERQANIVGKTFQNQQEIGALDMNELEQKGQLLNQHLSSAQNHFQFVGQQIAQEGDIIRTRALARADTIEKLTPPQLLQFIGKAKAAGGSVVIDGIPVSAAELQDASDRQELQDLSIQGARMSMANQKLEQADRYATRLGRSLTESQVKQAIANGGNWKGVAIPQDVLTQMLASHAQRDEMQASEAVAPDMKSVVQYGQGIMSAAQQAVTRAQSMFGGMGPNNPMYAGIKAHAEQLDALARKIREAHQGGTMTPQLAQVMGQEFAKAQKGINDQIDAAALRYAGGDKQTAQWFSSFMRGAPLDSQEGVRAMVRFAIKGNLPASMRMSPAAKAAFAAAQSAKAEIDNEINAQGAGKRPTQQQRDAAILQRAATNISRAYVGANMNRFIDAIPDLAKQAGDKFGGISREDFQRARVSADYEGHELVARQLGVRAEDVPLIASGRYQPAAGGKTIQELHGAYKKLEGEMAAQQHSAFLRNINQLPQVVHGQSNSTTMLRFVQSPTFAQMASNGERNMVGSGFGDYLVGSASQGQIAESLGGWASALGTVETNSNAAARQQAQFYAKAYANQPLRRASLVLGNIPGISKHEADRLIAAIQKNQIPVTNAHEAAGIVASEVGNFIGLESTAPIAIRENDRISSFIKTVRFKDPALEAVRKTAAANWDEYAPRTDGIMDRLLNHKE